MNNSNIEAEIGARLQVLDEEIEQLTNASIARSEEQTRLRQALELVRGQSAGVLATAATPAQASDKRPYVKSGLHKGKFTRVNGVGVNKSRGGKSRKRVGGILTKHVRTKYPWAPVHGTGSPWMLAILDLLEDGHPFAAVEIYEGIKARVPGVTQQQVYSVITNLKQSFRIIKTADGKWRRKYAPLPKENGASPAPTVDPVIAMLEQAVAVGAAQKEERGGGVSVYNPTRPVSN